MQELGPGPRMPEISDEQLEASKAAVRYQQIMRYEKMYRVVDGRLDDDLDEDADGRPLDPRFIELGIRILKEEAALYQLGKPVQQQEEEEDPSIQGVDRGAIVLAQLEDLEAKRRAQAEAAAQAAAAAVQDPAPGP